MGTARTTFELEGIGLHLYTALILALMATLVIFIIQMLSTHGLMGLQIDFGF